MAHGLQRGITGYHSTRISQVEPPPYKHRCACIISLNEKNFLVTSSQPIGRSPLEFPFAVAVWVVQKVLQLQLQSSTSNLLFFSFFFIRTPLRYYADDFPPSLPEETPHCQVWKSAVTTNHSLSLDQSFATINKSPPPIMAIYM